MSTATSYSADVRLWLRHDREWISLAEVGPNHVVPWERRSLPPTLFSEVVAEVDGKIRQWFVHISEEVDFFSEEIPVTYLPGGGELAPELLVGREHCSTDAFDLQRRTTDSLFPSFWEHLSEIQNQKKLFQ